MYWNCDLDLQFKVIHKLKVKFEILGYELPYMFYTYLTPKDYM